MKKRSLLTMVNLATAEIILEQARTAITKITDDDPVKLIEDVLALNKTLNEFREARIRMDKLK